MVAADVPAITYPHFHQVPIDSVTENLKWRSKLLANCQSDYDMQDEILRMCKEDSLFWVSSVAFLFEPRPKPKTIPFVPWPHQIPVWQEMERYIGVNDVGLEKSRGEGASWMVLMLMLHQWLFTEMMAIGFVSKDELAVDDPGNPDSMFWKLDFNLGVDNKPPQLPEWMVPNFSRNKSNHTFVNNDNGSTITGYAATGNVATGGRKTVFVFDELAKFQRGQDYHAMNSTFPVTDSRFLISSPWGPEGAYYDAMHTDSNMVKLRLHWSQNPTRSPGLYRVQIDKDNSRRVLLDDKLFWRHMARENGVRCDSDIDVDILAKDIVDETTGNPFGYPFMTTGPFVKNDYPRSPWYDRECQRVNNTPAGIAQELDIDYGGSTSRFFDVNLLVRLQKATDPPLVFGEMDLPDDCDSWHELQKRRFQVMHGGCLGLWFSFHGDLLKMPPIGHNYVVGADVGTGTAGVATSNSTLCVLNRSTGQQVAEFASPSVIPERFAEYAVALCCWFTGKDGNPAILNWEANGSSGTQFTRRIADLGFPFIYYRGSTEEMYERESGKMGFWSNNKTKPALLGSLQRALDRSECICASHHCLEEAKGYVNLGGDKIEHIAAVNEKDPSAAQARHGDRLIALALAWWLAKDYKVSGSSPASTAVDPPEDCMLARRMKAAKEAAREQAWVPPSQRMKMYHWRQ